MIRRPIILFVSVILLVVGISTVNAQGDDDPVFIEYIVTASSTANLRTGAGTSFGVAGTVSNGDSILVYDEEPEVEGWYRVYREDEEDAYIADFLVERAPTRFYPADQEPILTVSGRGTQLTDEYEIPRGAYRIDAVISDNAFILHSITLDGDCSDQFLLNELDISSSSNNLNISTLFVSTGCTVVFEVDNVSGNWEFALRDILDEDVLLETFVVIEDGTTISGRGHQLTMATHLSEGVWRINTIIEDNAFILRPQVLDGDCDGLSVLNELDFDVDVIEASTIYRSEEGGCIMFWETDNVDGNWEFSFEQIR
jgi:hypothetical protein